MKPGDDLVQVVRVAGLGFGEGQIVDAQHDHDAVGGEVQRLAAGPGIQPAAAGALQGGGAVDAEVAGHIAAGGEPLEHGGIGLRIALRDLVAEGDAVADAGDAHRLLLGGGGAGHGEEQNGDGRPEHTRGLIPDRGRRSGARCSGSRRAGRRR